MIELKDVAFLVVLFVTLLGLSTGCTPVEGMRSSMGEGNVVSVQSRGVVRVKRSRVAKQDYRQIKAVKAILIKIVDGDTIHVLINGVKYVIRIAFIDAPESFFYGKTQKGGIESKNNLIKLCARYMNKEIEVTILGKDVHETRVDGLANVGGVDASTYQIETGHAWVYTTYNQNVELPLLEASARMHRIGLWRDSKPVAPWIWRKEQKLKRAA